MLYRFFIGKLICLAVCALAGLCTFAGCAPHDYKAEADEQVYRIIDRKWQESFGLKANYRISDTVPSPNDIQIEKAVPVSGILTLPQAVAVATAHNRDYQTQKELLYSMALNLRLTRHQFETRFFGGLGGGYAKDWNDEVVSTEGSFGFNRLLATGTAISAGVASTWSRVLLGNMQGGWASVLTASVAQPLLRGSDRRVVLENLTQAERDTLYQVRSFNRFRKTFVVSVITQYYQVLKLFDAVKNAEQNYIALEWLYERSEKLANAGRLPKYELGQIRQSMLQASDAQIQAEKEYKLAFDLFKMTLSLPPTADFQLDQSELKALKAAGIPEPDFSETEGVEAGLRHRLDLANSADAIIDAERKVYVALDSLRAEVNVVGTAGAVVSKQTDPASHVTLKPLRDEYSLAIEFGLPLDRVAEQSVYRTALITLSQRHREYERMADTVALEVRQAYTDLTEATRRYEVLSEGLKLAEKRFREAFLLLQYGRLSSRRVLNAQQDLFDAQNESTKALVAYAIATLNFYCNSEVLGVRPDGMWERVSVAKTAARSSDPVRNERLSEK
jgi:outer membrane protein TolC